MLVCEKKRASLYRRFKFIDRLILVDRFAEIVSERVTRELDQTESILIPHGTLISQVGVEKIEEKLRIPVFGNKMILRWEADRKLKEKLMREAGLKPPRSISSAEKIDRLCIVKFPGAEGGRGYFLAYDAKSFRRELKERFRGKVSEKDVYIQEYVVGVPVYLHYFYSPLSGEVELLGVDRRYETTVDALGRLPSGIQLYSKISPSYIVVGNQPLVLRESLLEEVYSVGERFVEASKRLVAPGMIGPFCIEGVYDEEARFVPFEFSARIVAGTNLFIDGSPYSTLLYSAPMSMGRRIAREIRIALNEGKLSQISS